MVLIIHCCDFEGARGRQWSPLISKVLSLDGRKDSATTNTDRDDCYADREHFPERLLGLPRVVRGRRTGAGTS